MFTNNINIESATQQALITCQAAESYLQGNAFSRLWTWVQYETSVMPQWAESHIKATRDLENVVDQLHREGKEIPNESVTLLKHCKEVVSSLSDKVDRIKFQELIKKEPALTGTSGLLSGQIRQAVPEFAFEWQLNLGLMMDAYRRATPELKKEISFLVINYLAKAAPISIDSLIDTLDLSDQELEEIKKYKNLFQTGFFVEYDYHRERNQIERLLPLLLSKEVPEVVRNRCFLLDTEEISSLFPLYFIPVDLEDMHGTKILSQTIIEHFSHFDDQLWDQPCSKAILFDLTTQLSGLIMTHGDAIKEQEYRETVGKIKALVSGMIERAIAEVREARPDLLQTPQNEIRMIQWLESNINAICVSKIRNCPFIAYVSLYELSRNRLVAFIARTGLRMGGVSSRQAIFNFENLEHLLEIEEISPTTYTVSGSQETSYFSDPSEITQTALFKRFFEKTGHCDPHSFLAILGRSTLQLIEGLIHEISQEKWREVNADPVKRTLVQTCLFRMSQHLARAENHSNNFTQFTQAIELVHYEIATLLQLTKPFDPVQFQEIYSGHLSVVPQELKRFVTAGITKSAMNTFTAICHTVHAQTPCPQMVYGKDSYFEEAELIGPHRSVDEVLDDPSLPPIDLYVGEFNHNINIQPDVHHYSPGDPIKDVEKILRDTPGEHLTVAIDSTIDLVDSNNVRAFLSRFSTEIAEGRLNVIFFRSGQKFEMFGMDNYYGSPYYMIHNNGPQWDTFKRFEDQKAFQTDPLSLQWFCLVNKYAFQQLDDYRAAIIQNAKELHAHIPAPLQNPISPVRISTVDPRMDPVFIDLKIQDRSEITRQDIETIFYQKMMQAGRKAHTRGSFGFYHPNFNFINERIIRINPGLDPADNQIIISVLHEVASRVF